MTEYGSETVEFLQSHIDEHGFLSWLGVRVESLDPGHLVMRVPYDDVLTNPAIPGREAEGETVHGGVAATLIDTAGGLAVRSALSSPISTGVASIDLNVSYLRPASGDLVATADVVRTGRTIGVASVTVESEVRGHEHAEVAVGRGSYRIFQD
ncbi:MAG: PaaI family thioesterase [Halobacteriales archaeon]